MIEVFGTDQILFFLLIMSVTAVGTIIANEVPTAKCIIKDLSIPTAPKI